MNKKPHPPIQLCELITVGNIKGVVSKIYPNNSEVGVCEITYIHIGNKLTRNDVDWSGEFWFFPERRDFGGYVQESDPYLQIFKQKR